MTLAQFCIAAGATPKWIQNTARILDWRLRYTAEEARRAGLIHQLQEDLALPLAEAASVADEALSVGHSNRQAGSVVVGSGHTARIQLDLARYLSDSSVRLARALRHQPRRRGRRSRGEAGSVAGAREYGLDVSLLEASLRSTPADRLRRLDENLEFTKALRHRR